jgi:hypothetical protein
MRSTALEVDGELVPYAVAGVNATVFLSGIDPLHLRFVLPSFLFLVLAHPFSSQQRRHRPLPPTPARPRRLLIHRPDHGL